MTEQILIIVESPSKCKKVESVIKNSKCMSSCGHIYELTKGLEAINISNNFTPSYQIKKTQKANVNKLKSIKNKYSEIYLAMDPDREGEAIALHLAEALNIKRQAKRITFHEITKSAITESLSNPRKIDINLCNAQKARRILDRLMGFEISPLLWSHIKDSNTSLSAGRCQSPALQLISIREKEISNFSSNMFYSINGITIHSTGNSLDIKYPKKLDTLQKVKTVLENCLVCTFMIKKIKERFSKHSPKAPFTTSTLQQEASLKLGLSPKQTMSVAQKLYESGLITYMRTDSTTLSSEAKSKIKNKILQKYGDAYHKSRNYASKIKNAQEAHECIRVVDMDKKEISDNLQKRLYELIYNRTIASQMTDNKNKHYDITVCAIKNKKELYSFNAHQEEVVFDGYTKLYPDKKNKVFLVKEGDPLTLDKLEGEEDNDKPKTRYTEASLVKVLEQSGIGRPSTFSNIITTLLDRNYIIKKTTNDSKKRDSEIWYINSKKPTLQNKIVKKNGLNEKGKLFLTATGEKVLTFLGIHFSNLIDKNLTSQIEEDLDLVANGTLNWIDIVRKFYNSFHPTVLTLKSESSTTNNPRIMSLKKEIGKVDNITYGLTKTKYGMAFVKVIKNDIKFAPICERLFKDGKRISLNQLIFIFTLPITLYDIYTLHYGRYGFYIKNKNNQKSVTEDYSNGVLPTLEELTDMFNNNKDKKLFLKFGDITVLEGKYGPYILYKGKTYRIAGDIDINNLDKDKCMNIIKIS